LADVHAQVQRLVAVIKMAIVLEYYATKEQHSIVCLLRGKRTELKEFIKSCFLFTVEVFFRMSQMMPNQVALLRLTEATVNRVK
jgi:hypothetical protein